MVETDWERILSANPAALTDEEIEEICPAVIRCDVNEISDAHNLRILMKLSQEMLQYKDNQVEALLLECGELKQTISSLKPEASKRKKKDRDTTDAIRETGDFPKHTDVPESGSYEDALHGKNKKIKILMTELESLDKENLALKERLASLVQEMEDATVKMNETSEELTSAQVKLIECKEKMSYLERENAALSTQIEEINAQQIDRDKAIDEFGAAIDARISEWKAILDEKDGEINRLKENLSQSLIQSVTSVKEQNKSQIVYLNEEIDRREKLIVELQTKLSEAVVEINESTAVIEKLKLEAQKAAKTDKRKEQRDLLKKLQEANQRVSDLQNQLQKAEEEVGEKSRKLVDVSSTLRKYENGNEGLRDALNEIKELKLEMDHKNEHIQDLVNIVNKLEMLNSYQEMEIVTLRDKLGIREDESISIQNTVAKRAEGTQKLEELRRQNKILVEENLELKSDIRMLKFKLNKLPKDFDITADGSGEFLHSTKILEAESEQRYSKAKMNEMRRNMQIVIEENEALRTGMHEILDSIRNQDGKSEVVIQSSTLERLLEALDVRHLAGWYHPAMRLQEHLNVVQGSNAELRGQLKQLRKELQKKDTVLQNLALNKNFDVEKLCAEESEDEKLITHISELDKLQEAYQNEAEEWEALKDALSEENKELKTEVDKLKLQLEVYEKSMKILEEGEDEVKRSFVIRSKELVEASNEALTANKKITVLQQLLNNETTKLYQSQKESIKTESALRKAFAELSKQNKLLECEISTLQSDLSNSVNNTTYNELKEKYEEISMSFRNFLENSTVLNNESELEILKNELEIVKQEKSQLAERLQKGPSHEDDQESELQEVKAKEVMERQRADRMTKLYEIAQAQLSKLENNIKEIVAAKSELTEQLASLQNRLSRETRTGTEDLTDNNKIQELKDNNEALKAEQENLKKLLQVSQDEAQQQYSLNCLKTMELDSLRHQILDLQAASEDKATISRLDFELANKKLSEMELNSQNIRLENEVSRLREEVEKTQKNSENLRIYAQDCRKQCENRCRMYLEIISFLQSQYAGSTCLSLLNKVLSFSVQLRIEKQTIDVEMKKAKECHENAKVQQETLNNRLQIVESLKDMLEQQIGSNNVQDFIQRFSEHSQYTLNEFKYKRKVSQLEYELQIASNKFLEYEALIANMEQEMIEMQKTWSAGREESKTETLVVEPEPIPVQRNTISIQAVIETESVYTQTDPYTCCLEKKDFVEAEVQVAIDSPIREMPRTREEKNVKEVEYNKETKNDKNNKKNKNNDNENETGNINNDENKSNGRKINEDNKSNEGRNNGGNKNNKDNANIKNETDRRIDNEGECSTVVLYEQLSQALNLASERSTMLIKYESQIAEYQAKVVALNQMIENKDLQLTQKEKQLEEYEVQPQIENTDCSDKLALKSTINSLQQLVSQKEDTITRYQTLLKEDRDEHSRAAARLQEEIKSLQNRILAMQNEAQRKNEAAFAEVGEVIKKPEPKNRTIQEDEIARLNERILTLEADLKITTELSDRWHTLAEERLHHMDRMRERLEEQHKNELESYRSELTKWQTEADTLRKQLSENRMLLTKGNISLMKEMQERDDRIHELSLACQRLQNEIELMESASRTQQVIMHNEPEIKSHEFTHAVSRDPGQQHGQVNHIRRQLQSLMEKEKMYKHEIADLKQQLSRRYMAAKTQEKKTSQRELQFERKVRILEEELQKTRAQLDHEYLVQEAKKAKTAEELSLWEKQKKWQQTAEKLKEKLKEKTDEHSKLLSNYEKLRSVVTCMEREKWYLKSKLKVEGNTVAGGLSARPAQSARQNVVEELQKECQTLRNRVKELTDRLENEDNTKLLLKVEEQRRRIAALEAVSQGNTCVISQIEKLEMTKDILEKMNLKLESENFELRLELERINADVPRLKEKVDHLEKYVELLKIEKSSDSSPRSSEKDIQEQGQRKSALEMEKTIFTLKRIVERLQAENKRLRISSNKNHFCLHQGRVNYIETQTTIKKQFEEAQTRVIMLETDLQLAEKKIAMLEKVQVEDDNVEVRILKQQLAHKSELLDKVKQLFTKAVANERSLRQRIQQLESRHPLSTIPECYVTPATPE